MIRTMGCVRRGRPREDWRVYVHDAVAIASHPAQINLTLSSPCQVASLPPPSFTLSCPSFFSFSSSPLPSPPRSPRRPVSLLLRLRTPADPRAYPRPTTGARVSARPSPIAHLHDLLSSSGAPYLLVHGVYCVRGRVLVPTRTSLPLPNRVRAPNQPSEQQLAVRATNQTSLSDANVTSPTVSPAQRASLVSPVGLWTAAIRLRLRTRVRVRFRARFKRQSWPAPPPHTPRSRSTYAG
ncbi:hypothetical protein L227DRAFT_350917 [Lentinus tigrinus ALCF2SS1-6]|uniref:Uncharacterized protein n=1 Tax=Lentinus tigrinus ALCF2SS1-6 TaxID=1328759 RepID=A0A5C2RUQ7_9APHY|nr:hypothetical protein L227DRAFT_350917 [Lentinus tigrinus ALCF2SS1-6]